MAMDKTVTKDNSEAIRYVLIGMLAVAAFFGAYKFASAGSAQAASSTGVASATSAAGSPTAAALGGGSSAAAGGSCCGGAGGSGGASAGGSAAGGGCCGGSGATAKPLAGAAKVAGGVQKIGVKVTTSYSPNVLNLKAGVPAEITFSQSQGCTGIVQSAELGFQEDLTTGPKTVKLQALKPGTYGFACGMNMVTGKIVVH